MKQVPHAKIPLITFYRIMKENPIALRTKIFAEYGDIAWLKVKGINTYFVAHPEYAKHILKDNQDNYFKKHPLSQWVFEPFAGPASLFITNNYQQWKRDKMTTSVVFDPRVYFQDYANTATQLCKNMLAQWEQTYKNNDEVDVGRDIDKLLVSIVINTIFTQIPDRSEDYVKLLTNIPKLIKLKLLLPPWLWYFTATRKKYQQEINFTHKIAMEVVNIRAKDPHQYDDLLSLYIKDYKDLPPEEAFDLFAYQIVNMIVVSYFTTSSLLGWILTELSLRPEIERRIAHEVNRVVGDRLPTYDDIASLEYLSSFIKEILRLHPPLFAISRQAGVADTIGGFYIPANAGVTLSSYHIHRHPDFWNNPEGFDPERFQNNPLGQSHPFAYIPFGAGERKCMGSGFSTLEATLIVAMLVQRCNLQLLANQVVKPNVTTLLTMRSNVVKMKISFKK